MAKPTVMFGRMKWSCVGQKIVVVAHKQVYKYETFHGKHVLSSGDLLRESHDFAHYGAPMKADECARVVGRMQQRMLEKMK